MYVRGQNFGLMGLLGLGDFPGTAYVGRNAAEVRAMERCLSQGGRCRTVTPGAVTPGYFSQSGLCPGDRNVQCVFPDSSAAPADFDFFSWFRPAPTPSTPATAAAANAPGSGRTVFSRPGGSAPPGMPGPGTTGGSNVNASGDPVDGGITRSFSSPYTGMSTTGKIVVGTIGALALVALGVAIFKKPKATPAPTKNRRRRNAQRKPERAYHYRGDIERSHGLRGYRFHDGYSGGKPGVIEFPWSTKAECRKEAARDGFRAVFYRDGRRER